MGHHAGIAGSECWYPTQQVRTANEVTRQIKHAYEKWIILQCLDNSFLNIIKRTPSVWSPGLQAMYKMFCKIIVITPNHTREVDLFDELIGA